MADPRRRGGAHQRGRSRGLAGRAEASRPESTRAGRGRARRRTVATVATRYRVARDGHPPGGGSRSRAAYLSFPPWETAQHANDPTREKSAGRRRRQKPDLRPVAAQRSTLSNRFVITTIVLIRVDPTLIPTAANMLAGVDGVAEVYSVSGDWDLVAIVRVPQYDQIAQVVTEIFPTVPGIQRTQTLTAFRAYSKKDLQQAWDIGVE